MRTGDIRFYEDEKQVVSVFDTGFYVGATIGLRDDSVLSATVRESGFVDFPWEYRDNVLSLCITPDALRDFLRQAGQALTALDEFAAVEGRGEDTGEFRITQGEEGHTRSAAEILAATRRELARA